MQRTVPHAAPPRAAAPVTAMRGARGADLEPRARLRSVALHEVHVRERERGGGGARAEGARHAEGAGVQRREEL
jgi:hypothetical protein